MKTSTRQQRSIQAFEFRYRSIYFFHTPLLCSFALYFILSRDVPILKSFSAGRPKIFVCCSGGCSVAAVAELSWPIVACQNGRRKQRIAYRTFLFQYQYQRQTIEVTTWPSIYSQFKGHTQRFFASNKTLSCRI